MRLGELVDCARLSSVAGAPAGLAVQDHLRGQRQVEVPGKKKYVIDFSRLIVWENLLLPVGDDEPVGQGGYGGLSPARSAVVGDVLYKQPFSHKLYEI